MSGALGDIGAKGEPAFAITGDAVALEPLRRDLLPLYQRWLGDFEVGATYYNGTLIPATREAAEEWYERFTKPPGMDRAAGFTVYERATLRPIGVTSLQDIDLYNRRAMFGLMIGEKECWGNGYGTETSRLVLEYGFTCLGLHSVQLTVFSYNERAVRAYTRAGFRAVGRWREAKRFGGRAFDVICMDCLATEFRPSGASTLRALVPRA